MDNNMPGTHTHTHEHHPAPVRYLDPVSEEQSSILHSSGDQHVAPNTDQGGVQVCQLVVVGGHEGPAP